jgi:type II secretory pathway component GspD/PulD (secretin)
MKYFQTLAFVFAFALASTALVSTQEKEKPATAAPKTATPINVTPLKVQIVIGRYQGEKKISSLPYTLTMNANNHASLRMGTQVPVVMFSSPNPAMPKDMPQAGPIQYRDIGTNIDCSSTALEDGRYLLSISVDDSSVSPDEQGAGAAKNGPSFRSFRATDTMVLKNGETGQFTTATDKVSGDTMRVDVTLTVMK